MLASDYSFLQLPAPLALVDQTWPRGTPPLVSVRVTTYMHGSFIRRCVDGVLMQRTTFPVQILLHDDASSDGTAEIIQQYQARYPGLVRAICQPENTYSSSRRLDAMRSLLALSEGTYEALCEGDDYWTDPLKLQKQVEFLTERPEYSGCFHAVHTVDATDVRLPEYYPPFGGHTLRLSEMVWRHFIPTASFVYRREISRKSISFRTAAILSGDMFLEMSCALFGSIGYINEVMGCYRRHSGGITRTALHTNLRKSYEGQVALFDALIKSAAANGCDSSVLFPRMAAAYITLGMNRVRSDGWWPAARCWCMAAGYLLRAPGQVIRQLPLMATTLRATVSRRLATPSATV